MLHMNAFLRIRLALTEDWPTIKTICGEGVVAELRDSTTATVRCSVDLLAVPACPALGSADGVAGGRTVGAWREASGERANNGGVGDTDLRLALAAPRGAYYAAPGTRELVMVGVKLAESDAEILRCYPVMAQLRTHRDRSEEFAGLRLRRLSRPRDIAWLTCPPKTRERPLRSPAFA